MSSSATSPWTAPRGEALKPRREFPYQPGIPTGRLPLAFGGTDMRTMLAALSFALVLAAGCRPAAPTPEPAPVAKGEPKKDPPKVEPGKKDDTPAVTPSKPPERGGSVNRAASRVQIQSMLQNLYKATKNFMVLQNRYPNSKEELEEYYEKNAAINEALKSGDIVYLWKAKKTEEPAILAYEGQPDTLGIRVVLLTNGDTQTVNAEDFKTMPKVQTK
jgi:hypothetical protein